MSAILRINLENKSTITTPPAGYISLFAGADAGAPFTNNHLSVIDSTGSLLRVPYLEENLTVATGYNFQQSVDVSGSLWVGTNHSVVANTILGSTCANTLKVNATSSFNCPVTFNGGITLSGVTTICGDVNMCGCPKPAGMTGNTATTVPTLHVSKISACTGTLSISNNVDICGDLNMCCVKTDESWTGATSANTGTTAVTTTLTVSQISGCSGTLNIVTPTTIFGNLNLCEGAETVVTTTYITGCSYNGLVASTCVSGGTPITGYTATTSAVTVTSTTYNTLSVNNVSACTGTLSILNSVDVNGSAVISGNTYIADGALTLGDESGLWTTIDSGNVITDRNLSFGGDGLSGDTWSGEFIHAGGTGRTVTQSASTTTTVTINSSTGRIRAYNAGGSVLSTQTSSVFRVYNNKVRTADSLVFLTCTNTTSPVDANLTVSLQKVQPGYFDIRMFNSGNGNVDLTLAGNIHFMIVNHE
tara:strand:- start:9323 stop:10747 length:1425 start_codon:yes stop_codon:yes gene_type:complete